MEQEWSRSRSLKNVTPLISGSYTLAVFSHHYFASHVVAMHKRGSNSHVSRTQHVTHAQRYYNWAVNLHVSRTQHLTTRNGIKTVCNYRFCVRRASSSFLFDRCKCLLFTNLHFSLIIQRSCCMAGEQMQ